MDSVRGMAASNSAEVRTLTPREQTYEPVLDSNFQSEIDLSHEPAIEPQSSSSTDDSKANEKPAELVSSAANWLPEKHPDWITMPDRRDGNSDVMTIVSLPSESIEKSEASLIEMARARLSLLARKELAVDPQIVQSADEEWIAERISPSQDRFSTEHELDGTVLYQIWAELRLTPEAKSQLIAWQSQSQWKPRSMKMLFCMLGAITACGLLHCGFAWQSARLARTIQR